jgi:hypothetical protein
MSSEKIEPLSSNETQRSSELRRLINNAMNQGQLRASDCRQALRLQGAGMPIGMIINYVKTMIAYTAKTRTPRHDQFPQDLRH